LEISFFTHRIRFDNRIRIVYNSQEHILNMIKVVNQFTIYA
jgi:hypothetical protein